MKETKNEQQHTQANKQTINEQNTQKKTQTKSYIERKKKTPTATLRQAYGRKWLWNLVPDVRQIITSAESSIPYGKTYGKPTANLQNCGTWIESNGSKRNLCYGGTVEISAPEFPARCS